MHFFIEHTQLPVQKPEDSFGVLASDPTNKFTITSSFQLTTNQKAFACQDGMMIIQQSAVNENLVNIILKPTQGLTIPFTSVKYYVYRGVLKESFIVSGFIKAASQTPANAFLERFWKNVENYKSVAKKPDLPDPTPDALGFDDFIENTVSVERIFDNSQLETRAIYVKEGEWIGDFGTLGKIGFEIIVETDNFDVADFGNQIDLGYLRKGNHLIDVTGLTGFNKRAKQELILSYIDPCAFFGLHYENGVNVSVFTATTKTIETKKKADLYTLLEKFATKNRVYLDIRSELGYSYNFYQNYKESNIYG